MNLTFNDGDVLEVQSINDLGYCIKIRIINKTPTELRKIFEDTFKLKRIICNENREPKVYENFTELEYVSDYTGGIREVSLIHSGETVEEKIAKNEQSITDIQLALCEVYEMMGV